MDIEWENPPEDVVLMARNYSDQFVTALLRNPGNWAIYRRSVKQRSTKMKLSKKYPDIMWRSMLKEDGTYTIWGRTKED